MLVNYTLLAAHVIFCGSALYGAFLSIRWNRPALAVFLGFCFFYLSFRGVMLLSGAYGIFGILHGGKDVPVSSMTKLFGLVLLFVVVVLIGYGRVRDPQSERRIHSSSPPPHTHLAFLVVWSACIIALNFAESIPNLNWIFSFVILGGIYLLLYVPRLYPRVVTVSIGLAGLVFALGQTIERRDWAIAFASAFLIVIISQSKRLLRTSLVALTMLAVIAFTSVMLRTGDKVSIGDTLSRLSADALLPIVEHELDFPLVYDALLIMVDNVPEKVDFTYGKYFFKPLYSWIPRDIWTSKPDSISRYYCEMLNPGFHARGGSEPVTFVGELYWNFSIIGVFFAWLLGFSIKRIDEYWIAANDVLKKTNGLLLATMLFYLLRGPIDTFWLAYVFYFAAWFGVSTISFLLISVVVSRQAESIFDSHTTHGLLRSS